MPRRVSAIDDFILDVKRIIPRVAENERCRPTDALAYGLNNSRTKSANDSDVILSRSRRKRGADIRNICIIPARVTAGVNPVIAIKNNNIGIP